MTKTNNELARRYFNAKTIRALAKKGARVIDATWGPGADGSFANGQTLFSVDENGTAKVRTFLDVLAMAGAR
jgi:hypothetical protein